MSTKVVLSQCINCGKSGKLRCSRCKAVNYCSPTCQKVHWTKGHKGECNILSGNQPKQFISSTPSDASAPNEQALSTELSKLALIDENSNASDIKARDEVPSPEWLFPQKRVLQMMQFHPPYINVGKGLYNFMNSCYMNSVLQCFTYTLPLFNYLISQDHSSKCKLSKSGHFCMLCALEDHLFHVLLTEQPHHYPRNIYMNLQSIGEFAFFQQEDAHDFAYGVLGAIQKSLLANLESKPSFKQEETTLLYQLFGGQIQSQIKCNSCSKIYTSYESFLDLMLDLSSNAKSLEEALQNYTTIEHFDESVGWKCESCARPVSAQKQLTIYNSPNILLLTLKRFDLMQGGYKVNKPVVYRETLSLKRIISKHSPDKVVEYDLYAVVVHFGQSIFAGHYVAFVKIDGGWVLFDDSKVVEVDQSVVLKQNAYMLFYKKNYQQDSGSMAPAPLPASLGTKKQRGQRSSQMPEISSTSNATAAGATKPKCQVFYRIDERGVNSFIKDLVLKISVPNLLSLEGTGLQLGTSGRILFSAQNLYSLDVSVPFIFDVTNASAEFYPKEGLIVSVIPIVSDSVKSDNIMSPVKMSVQHDKSKIDSLDIDENNEVSLTNLVPSSSSQNNNVEESTYSRLYKEIKQTNENTAATHKNVIKAQTAQNHQQQMKKLGRNDDCPCGSGKKYKKCHGIRG